MSWLRAILSALRWRRKRFTYIPCGFHRTEYDPRCSITRDRNILGR